MISLKNKWMISFIICMCLITYVGTLFTSHFEVKSDIHNTECQNNI